MSTKKLLIFFVMLAAVCVAGGALLVRDGKHYRREHLSTTPMPRPCGAVAGTTYIDFIFHKWKFRRMRRGYTATLCCDSIGRFERALATTSPSFCMFASHFIVYALLFCNILLHLAWSSVVATLALSLFGVRCGLIAFIAILYRRSLLRGLSTVFSMFVRFIGYMVASPHMPLILLMCIASANGVLAMDTFPMEVDVNTGDALLNSLAVGSVSAAVANGMFADTANQCAGSAATMVAFANAIVNVDAPVVVVASSPAGTGKLTFVKRLIDVLKPRVGFDKIVSVWGGEVGLISDQPQFTQLVNVGSVVSPKATVFDYDDAYSASVEAAFAENARVVILFAAINSSQRRKRLYKRLSTSFPFYISLILTTHLGLYLLALLEFL